MKKTQWIELFHTIRRTMVTFIAIILFVTMGMALFFGISWSGDSITASANDFFVKGSLADLELQYIYGFDEPFIEELASIEGVDKAEGYYQAYEFLPFNSKTYEVRITSLTDDCNKAVQIKGNLPQRIGEIAVESFWAKEHGITVGDTIVFSHDDNKADYLPIIVNTEKDTLPTALFEQDTKKDADGLKYLLTDTFTVTALVETAPYLNRYTDMYGISFPDAIPVNCLMFADASSFNTTAFPGYTNIAVKADETGDKNYFSDNHKKHIDELKEKLTPVISAYTDAKNTKIAEKQQYLEALGTEIPEEVKAYSCNISTSEDNSSLVGLKMMITIFEKLRYSMAGLFVIIGVLICFFTVSRIVYESTVLIGTKKSLGFNKWEIMRLYLLYAGLAAIIGSACGASGARFIVEPILLIAVKDAYQFDTIIYVFKTFPAALFGILEIVLQMLAVYISCRRIFRKNTLHLLRGDVTSDAKTRFYEKTHLWKKISLFSKTIINNFFDDKRRFFSTVTGVATCSSLIVCALTLNNHILGSFERQYQNIYNFDGIVYFNADSNHDEIDAVLSEKGIAFTEVYSTHIVLNSPNGRNIASYLYVAEKENLEKIMNIADFKDKNKFDGGFWSSCSYAEEFGMSAGDIITFTDENKTVHTISSGGFFEYYLINNLIVTDTQSFCSEFGSTYIPNTYFVSSGGYDFDKLSDELSDCEGFIYLNNDYETSKMSFDGFADVFSIIVAVYLALAAAMAILVLLNLFVMFVSEKKRELLTLLVNGYGLRDARRYIWLDTLFLSIIGILSGIVFGTIMADISLSAYKNETLYFLSGTDHKACIIGVVLSSAFTALTAAIALRQISKFRLTEINTQ